ncbi:pyrophosphatase [Promicromonospora sp. NPDC052451]|uniref:pyrophosphatase n=1 Tax=unclassified Promicromonospora TaxID=2647929 RepID=UPI0037C6CD9E
MEPTTANTPPGGVPGLPPAGLAALADEVEVISRVYERKFGVPRTDDWLVLKLQEEMGEFVQAYLARTGRSRDRGRSAEDIDADLRAEFADVFGQLLVIARRFDIDIEAELARKWFRWSDLVEPQDREGI